mgnify:CR=1 FL=1
MTSNGYFAINRAARQISESNDRVALAMLENGRHVASSNRQIAESNNRLGDILRESSDKEIAARDRVDITLSEYLKLKQDIAMLSEENRTLKALYGKIGLPCDVPILPDSIRKYQCIDSPGFMDLTQRFLIEFKCDMSALSPEQKRYMIEEFMHV